METVESSRLLLLNTHKPGWVGTSAAKEVKYLAEMASLAVSGDRDTLRAQPPIFVAAYCTTSPLKVDTRSCEVLGEALKYGFPVNFAPMPILGATAPMTPAGAVIVATAEILGCLTATSLLNPDVYYFSTSITGEMDMKTTQVCYCTPAAILTDVALHQLFRRRYGIVHNVEPGYVEAKVPGLQAAFMKTYRQMAFGCTVSMPLPIGALDNAAAFSPTQAMLDLEMNEAIYKFSRGIDVNADTCAEDLIDQVLFGERQTYLESEHTLAHFRQVGWNPRLWDRSYLDHTQPAPCGDERILQQADQAWRNWWRTNRRPKSIRPQFGSWIGSSRPLARNSSQIEPGESTRSGHAEHPSVLDFLLPQRTGLRATASPNTTQVVDVRTQSDERTCVMPRIVILLLVGVAGLRPAWSQELVVWVASQWQHVLRSTEPSGAKSAEIAAARNEYEPLRVIVHAGVQALANVRVEASILTGPAGQIEARNVALFREHSIHGRATADMALKIFPHSAATYKLRARAHRGLGNHAKAVADDAKAKELEAAGKS